MAFSRTKTHNLIRYLVMLPLFLITLIILIWDMSLTRTNVSVSKPDSGYQVQHKLCQDYCRVVRNIGCREWFDAAHPKLCEFVCDTYLDKDLVQYSKRYETIFTCAKNSESEADIESCGLTCTAMDLL